LKKSKIKIFWKKWQPLGTDYLIKKKNNANLQRQGTSREILERKYSI
jgi:hypothetical protein